MVISVSLVLELNRFNSHRIARPLAAVKDFFERVQKRAFFSRASGRPGIRKRFQNENGGSWNFKVQVSRRVSAHRRSLNLHYWLSSIQTIAIPCLKRQLEISAIEVAITKPGVVILSRILIGTVVTKVVAISVTIRAQLIL